MQKNTEHVTDNAIEVQHNQQEELSQATSKNIFNTATDKQESLVSF
jgi:hypothetical protein